MKFFSDREVRVKILRDCGAVETAALLREDSHKLCVVLNWQTEGSDRILTEVSQSVSQSQVVCSRLYLVLIKHKEVALALSATRNRWLNSQSDAIYRLS